MSSPDDLDGLLARVATSTNPADWRDALRRGTRVGRLDEVLAAMPALADEAGVLRLFRELEVSLGDSRWQLPDFVNFASLSPDGSRLALSAKGVGIQVLDTRDGRVRGSLGPSWHCSFLAFDRAGTLVRGGYSAPPGPGADFQVDPARPIQVTQGETRLEYRAVIAYVVEGWTLLGSSEDGTRWAMLDPGREAVTVVDLSAFVESPPGAYPRPEPTLAFPGGAGEKATAYFAPDGRGFLLNLGPEGGPPDQGQRYLFADLGANRWQPVHEGQPGWLFPYWSPGSDWLAASVQGTTSLLDSPDPPLLVLDGRTGRLHRSLPIEKTYRETAWRGDHVFQLADDLFDVRDGRKLDPEDEPPPLDRWVRAAEAEVAVRLDGPAFSCWQGATRRFGAAGHPYPIRDVQVAPGVDRVMTRDGAGGVRVWRWSSGEVLWEGAPDGTRARLAEGGGHLLRWSRRAASVVDLDRGVEVALPVDQLVPHPRQVDWADLSADGEVALLVHRRWNHSRRPGEPGDVTTLVDVSTGARREDLPHPFGHLTPGSFFVGDQLLVAAVAGQVARRLDRDTLDEVEGWDLTPYDSASFPGHSVIERSPARWTRLSTDAHAALWPAGRDGLVVWNRGAPLLLEAGRPATRMLPAGVQACAAATRPGGAEVALLGDEGWIRRHRWEPEGGVGEPLDELQAAVRTVPALAYSPDGACLLYAQGCALRIRRLD